MTTKTIKAKATGKTQYISQTVYKGTRTRTGADAEIYRGHALESLKKLERKRAANQEAVAPRRQYA
jgi:hypothetical protein